MLKNTFTVTDDAYMHLKKLVLKNASAGILLGLKNSGCSGLSYIIGLAQTAEEYNTAQQISFNDLNVFVNPEHLYAFAGMKIDYIQDGLNGRLIFKNPNTHSECGCGSSFKVKEHKDSSN
jgi:iron-sulfur cluster assembly protein